VVSAREVGGRSHLGELEALSQSKGSATPNAQDDAMRARRARPSTSSNSSFGNIRAPEISRFVLDEAQISIALKTRDPDLRKIFELRIKPKILSNIFLRDLMLSQSRMDQLSVTNHFFGLAFD